MLNRINTGTIERQIELSEREVTELARILYFQITHGFEPKSKRESREITLLGSVVEKLFSAFPRLAGKSVVSVDPRWIFKEELPRLREVVEKARRVVLRQP